MVRIFHQTIYIRVGWIIYIGMLSWRLKTYTFSEIRMAIFEPVLIILSITEYKPFFDAPSSYALSL